MKLLNEHFIFIRDNNILKNKNFNFFIGDKVILKNNALEIHIKDISDLFVESTKVINLIRKNIGKKFEIIEVAYDVDTNKFFVELKDNETGFYISANSVTKKPTYDPKGKNKRLLESNGIKYYNPIEKEFTQYKYRFKTEEEFEKEYGRFWYSSNYINWAYSDQYQSGMNNLFGKTFKVNDDELLFNQYKDRVLNRRYIDENNDGWSIGWWMLTENEIREPSYTPKINKRVIENINEDYKFIKDNEKLKEIKFPYRIGDFVIFKKNAVDLHINNILFQEDDFTLNYIKNNIGKSFEISNVAYCDDNDKYYLELKMGNSVIIWVYEGAVKLLKPYYEPKKIDRLLESGNSGHYRFKTKKEFIKEFGSYYYEKAWWAEEMDILLGEPYPKNLNLPNNDHDGYIQIKMGNDYWCIWPKHLVKIEPTYTPKNRNQRLLENYNDKDNANEIYIKIIDDDDRVKLLNLLNNNGYNDLPMIIENDIESINNLYNNRYTDRYRYPFYIFVNFNGEVTWGTNSEMNGRDITSDGAYDRVWDRLLKVKEDYHLIERIIKNKKIYDDYKPIYKPKGVNKRLLESTLFDDESTFRVWCDTTEKAKEFEQLLYDWGWKWDTFDNIRISVNSKLTFLFFFDRKKFDAYSYKIDDGLELLLYPDDYSIILNKFNKSPKYIPKKI